MRFPARHLRALWALFASFAPAGGVMLAVAPNINDVPEWFDMAMPQGMEPRAAAAAVADAIETAGIAPARGSEAHGAGNWREWLASEEASARFASRCAEELTAAGFFRSEPLERSDPSSSRRRSGGGDSEASADVRRGVGSWLAYRATVMLLYPPLEVAFPAADGARFPGDVLMLRLRLGVGQCEHDLEAATSHLAAATGDGVDGGDGKAPLSAVLRHTESVSCRRSFLEDADVCVLLRSGGGDGGGTSGGDDAGHPSNFVESCGAADDVLPFGVPLASLALGPHTVAARVVLGRSFVAAAAEAAAAAAAATTDVAAGDIGGSAASFSYGGACSVSSPAWVAGRAVRTFETTRGPPGAFIDPHARTVIAPGPAPPLASPLAEPPSSLQSDAAEPPPSGNTVSRCGSFEDESEWCAYRPACVNLPTLSLTFLASEGTAPRLGRADDRSFVPAAMGGGDSAGGGSGGGESGESCGGSCGWSSDGGVGAGAWLPHRSAAVARSVQHRPSSSSATTNATRAGTSGGSSGGGSVNFPALSEFEAAAARGGVRWVSGRLGMLFVDAPENIWHGGAKALQLAHALDSLGLGWGGSRGGTGGDGTQGGGAEGGGGSGRRGTGGSALMGLLAVTCTPISSGSVPRSGGDLACRPALLEAGGAGEDASSGLAAVKGAGARRWLAGLLRAVFGPAVPLLWGASELAALGRRGTAPGGAAWGPGEVPAGSDAEASGSMERSAEDEETTARNEAPAGPDKAASMEPPEFVCFDEVVVPGEARTLVRGTRDAKRLRARVANAVAAAAAAAAATTAAAPSVGAARGAAEGAITGVAAGVALQPPARIVFVQRRGSRRIANLATLLRVTKRLVPHATVRLPRRLIAHSMDRSGDGSGGGGGGGTVDGPLAAYAAELSAAELASMNASHPASGPSGGAAALNAMGAAWPRRHPPAPSGRSGCRRREPPPGDPVLDAPAHGVARLPISVSRGDGLGSLAVEVALLEDLTFEQQARREGARHSKSRPCILLLV